MHPIHSQYNANILGRQTEIKPARPSTLKRVCRYISFWKGRQYRQVKTKIFSQLKMMVTHSFSLVEQHGYDLEDFKDHFVKPEYKLAVLSRHLVKPDGLHSQPANTLQLKIFLCRLKESRKPSKLKCTLFSVHSFFGMQLLFHRHEYDVSG